MWFIWSNSYMTCFPHLWSHEKRHVSCSCNPWSCDLVISYFHKCSTLQSSGIFSLIFNLVFNFGLTFFCSSSLWGCFVVGSSGSWISSSGFGQYYYLIAWPFIKDNVISYLIKVFTDHISYLVLNWVEVLSVGKIQTQNVKER